MSKAITSKQGRLWIQPDGPGNTCYPLSCRDAGDLTETLGSLEVIRRFNDAGDGWDVIGETESPPDPISFSVDVNIFEDKDWLEKVACPYSLYLLSRDCGRADVFNNWVRGRILSHARNASYAESNLTMREEDTAASMAVDIEAWPPLLKVNQVTFSRIANAGTVGINDIVANLETRCEGDCGAQLDKGEQVTAVADATAGVAGPVYLSTDFGETYAAAAAAPFAVGVANHVVATARCYVGRSTVRRFAAKLFGAGTQGVVARSDDNGASWTSANVGGAAAGHGCTVGGGLYFNGPNFGFVASAAGYIYKSIDGGQTWVAKESGTITAGNYAQIHFSPDGQYGIAGAAADIISLSSDYGESWQVATATGTGDAIGCVWRFNKNRMLVGTSTGHLFQSQDGGVTWQEITGWTGSGTGVVIDFSFVNDHQGFMVHNTGAPVGSVLRTINGGANWDVVTAPANSGLSCVYAVTADLAYVGGEINAATGFFGKISAA